MKLLKFDFGPKGHFFLRAKGVEDGQICYSDYKKAFITS